MTTVAVEKHDEKPEKRKALGRGLASLLPGPRVVASTEPRVPSPEQEIPPFAKDAKDGAPSLEEPPPEVISIQAQAVNHHMVSPLAVELIEKNPYQTRYVFDEEQLQELADSIKENGVVQPVVVRPAEEEGRFILVLGERRLRASKMAGQRTIPAIVRRLSPQQAAEMTVLENVQREDLNPLEQAEAFSRAEQGIPVDPGTDCGAAWSVAGDGIELHAAVAAAAGSDGVFALGAADFQRLQGAAGAGERRAHPRDRERSGDEAFEVGRD